MYRYFIITLLFILSAASSNARKWTPETLPMVHLKDATKYVCNPDGVLKPATVDSADALLSALERDKGVQTVVVVVKQLEGDDPYSFGMALGKRYGIGDGKQRTGLILILATEDRSYQLLTGNGLEGTIPDAISRRIQNRVMVPELKKGDWDKAIANTLKSIDGYVRGDETLRGNDDEEDNPFGSILVLAFTFTFIAFIYILSLQSNRRTCPKCGKHKLTLKKKTEKISGKRIMIEELWRCKSCGYEETRHTDKPNDEHNGNRSGGRGIPPFIFFPPTGGGHGGPTGGSFGGGTFGGGGSGGRF